MQSSVRLLEESAHVREEEYQPVGHSLAESMAASILQAFADSFSRSILDSTIAAGKSIEEVAVENEIPTSSAYRRMHELVESGLLVMERIVIAPGGKRHAVFRSVFQGIRIEFREGGLQIVCVPNEGIPDVNYRLWLYAHKSIVTVD
jgi:hypothetical protein